MLGAGCGPWNCGHKAFYIFFMGHQTLSQMQIDYVDNMSDLIWLQISKSQMKLRAVRLTSISLIGTIIN